MNMGFLKNLQIFYNSVIFRHSVANFIPAYSVGKATSYGTIVVCVGAIAGARNIKIIFFQATASPSIMPSIVIALHGAHSHLGPEAQ